MKTLVLSSDDIQNFSKLIYDPKVAANYSTTTGIGGGAGTFVASGMPGQNLSGRLTKDNSDIIALQYYLKHPGSYNQQKTTPVTALAQTQHQQLLSQSQTQLKQLQLKQPTIHQQHTSYHHHHPYYQQSNVIFNTHTQAQTHNLITPSNHSHSNTTQQNHNHAVLPVHALNQNSNFSAASSSTGGGTTTTSSHAPTQQSNSSGMSPTVSSIPATSNIKKQQQHLQQTTSSATTVAAANALLRANGVSSSSAAGNCAKKIKTEPILSAFNQTERLNFANTHIGWSEEHWKRVIFQDERKFNLDGPDGFSYYFHDLRNYERMLSQRPRGNSVYIYLLITVGGPIHLEVSTTKLKTESCIETILRERPSILGKLGGNRDFILQDHNWMLNALPSAQEWLNAEGLKTQKWPTIAHDLNIMENIWGWLIREVFEGGRKFSRKDDLIFRIREAWGRLPTDLITNLYTTLPERITELYYTRGVYTNC